MHCGPGDMFGEMALVGDSAPRRSATVEALEEAETYSVHELDFARIRRKFPDVNDVVIRYSWVEEVRVMNERLLEAHYVSAAERRVSCDASASSRGYTARQRTVRWRSP